MQGSFEIISGCEDSLKTLSSHLLIKRNNEVMISACPDSPHRTCLLHPSLQKCYELGGAGSRIWELIQEPVTVGQVVGKLLEEYEVDRLTCETEVFSYLAKLSEQKLIWFGM